MKRGVLVACAVAVLLGGLSSSEAAIRRWSGEVGIHGGYEKMDADLEVKDDWIYGATLGLSVFPAFQVEAIFATVSTESAKSAYEGSDFSLDFTGLRLVGTFRAGEDSKVKPYVVAGGGTVKNTFDKGGTRPVDDDNAAYGEIGVGVRYFLWKDLDLRGEAGLRHLRTLGVTQSDFHFTVGVSFFFLGKKS